MLLENIKSIALIGLASALLFSCQRLNSLQDELKEAQRKALEQSIVLTNQINDIKEAYSNDQKEADAIISDLRQRVANGVHIKNRDLPADSTSKTGEDGCDLSARTAGDLISIAERGDKAIRQLNQCIDSYNALRNGRLDNLKGK